MIIQSSSYLPFPRSLVYFTYRDQLVKLVPFLPNVRQITVESRREKHGLTYLVNLWHDGGKLSAIIQAIWGQEILSWRDYEIWSNTEFAIDWRIKIHPLSEAVYCAGRNCFLEVDGGTQIECLCQLIIEPEKVGIPPCMASQLAPTVEGFLSKRIALRLSHLNEGACAYLMESQRQK